MESYNPKVPEMDAADETSPEYEPPRVLTYRGEEILEWLGPAKACSFSASVTFCTTPTPGT